MAERQTSTLSTGEFVTEARKYKETKERLKQNWLEHNIMIVLAS